MEQREERSDQHREGTETEEEVSAIIGGSEAARPGEDESSSPGGDVHAV